MSQSSIQNLRAVRHLCLLVVLVSIGGLAWALYDIPTPEAPEPADQVELSWPTLDILPADAWKAFRDIRTGTKDMASASSRFRLAGTFQSISEPNTTSPSRATYKAIVDDLQVKKQFLLGEGELIAEYEVLRIERNRVVLRDGLEEYELTLGLAQTPSAASSSAPPQATRRSRAANDSSGIGRYRIRCPFIV